MSTGPENSGQQPQQPAHPATTPPPGYFQQGHYYPGQPVVGAPMPGQPMPYAPAFDPRTPYLQQPPQQQYFANPMPGPVSYVISAPSLKGLRGWLMFFMIWAGWCALWLGGQTIWVLNSGSGLNRVFVPALFVASLACVITAAMELAVARWVFIGWAVAWFCHNVAQAMELNGLLYGGSDQLLQATIVTSGVFCGFIVLYFLTSKRVKETLVK